MRTVDTGATVDDMALGTRLLWVAQHDAGRVAAIDVTTGTTRWVAVVPGALSLVGDDQALWVTAEVSGAGRLLRLDPANGAIMAETAAGVLPVGLTTLASEVWIADERRGVVDVYDEQARWLASVPTGAGLVDLATDGHTIWASSSASSELVQIDPSRRRVVHRYDTPGQPFKIDGGSGLVAATSPDSGRLILESA